MGNKFASYCKCYGHVQMGESGNMTKPSGGMMCRDVLDVVIARIYHNNRHHSRLGIQ